MKLKLSLLLLYILLNNKNLSQNNYDSFIVKINNIERNIFFSKPTLQQSSKRKIINKKTKKIYEIGGINDTLLFSPSGLATDKNENIYVVDYIGKFVKKFDKYGKFLKQYGKSGKGPGEFIYPVSISVDNFNNLYVFDDNLWKITVFNNDKTKNEVKVLGGTSEFLPFNNEKIIVLSNKDNSMDFVYAIDDKGKLINKYENFLENKKKFNELFFLTMIFNGKLLNLSNNRFVLLPVFFNKMIFYKDNKIEKIISTIDEDTKPIFNINSKNNYQALNIGDMYYKYEVNIDAFYFNNKIYVFTRSSKKNKNGVLFDVYDSNSGIYNYTIQIDTKENFYVLHLTQNRIYFITEDMKVKAYSYE